jgi:hypothetical protein
MGTDYAEKEREFIDSLAEDSGRSLDQWMQAITAAGPSQRNDIIDWLRQQGFAFPKASWLERIYHNGGRLIYAGGVPGGPVHARRLATAPRTPYSGPAESVLLTADTSTTCAPTSLPGQDVDYSVNYNASVDASVAAVLPGLLDSDIAQFLGAAKGLKPLAEFVLREIETAVPGPSYTVAAPYLTIAAPAAFAALHPAPKELRLYADFGAGLGGRVRKAEASQARGAPPFPEVLTLNDARQIDGAFRDLVASAYTRALK